MLTVAPRKSWFAVAVVLALVPVLLSAEPANASKVKNVPSPAEIVRDKLDQTHSPLIKKGDFEVDQSYSLKQVLGYLSETYGVKFEFDDRTFEDEKVPMVRDVQIPGQEVLKNNIKMKDAVRWLLRLVPSTSEATYVIIGDTVLITTIKMMPYRWMHQSVNLECEKEELSSALKRLAHETGANLVIDGRATKEAQTRVTLEVHDEPLDTTVLLLAEMVGLQPVRVGNALFLTTKENAKEMRADPDRARVVGPCPLPPEPFPDKTAPLP
jgi:hypothetical protein